MTEPKTWVAIRYALPKADRSSAYKKLFGYSWTERRALLSQREMVEKHREPASRRVSAVEGTKVHARWMRTGPMANQELVALPPRNKSKVFREYKREVHAELEGIPYSRLGRGVILVPPSHASRALGILKSRGCTVSVARGITSSQEQYQASNAYFLGQWQSYLSGLEGMLANAEDGDRAKSSLQLALGLSDRFLKDVKALPVASVPEDIEVLSMKPRIEEALKACTSRSEAQASVLASLREDVENQLEVLREQGKDVLAAL